MVSEAGDAIRCVMFAGAPGSNCNPNRCSAVGRSSATRTRWRDCRTSSKSAVSDLTNENRRNHAGP